MAGMVDGQGRSVGVPSDLEARKYLTLNNGNVLTASHKIYAFRKKKVSSNTQTQPHVLVFIHS